MKKPFQGENEGNMKDTFLQLLSLNRNYIGSRGLKCPHL